jgi:hypothetical protein
VAAKQQEFVVHSVAAGLEKLSSVDLMFRLTATFGGDYEKLRSDFNSAMEKLQETMKAIATNTRGMRSGAEEITQASDDLSRRGEPGGDRRRARPDHGHRAEEMRSARATWCAKRWRRWLESNPRPSR